MNKDYLVDGRIPTYRIQDELVTLVKVPEDCPSSRIIRTKKGKRAIAALIQLEANNNHNVYTEIALRAKKHMNKVALFYRGTEITYKEMLEKAYKLAKYLLEIGIQPGEEIPVCMVNTPELVYLLLAANKIGAKLNIFGEQFNEEYLREILAECTDKVFFSDDSRYEHIKGIVEESDIKRKVIVSLADSLPKHPEQLKTYEPELDSYYRYPNKAVDYQKEDPSIQMFGDVLQIGEKSQVPDRNYGDLETDFLVTYTSGSTIVGKPKAMIHKNRSVIVSGRFHDSELSGNPDMKDLRCLAHIPPESNTDVISCILDNLSQGWSVGLEPEYDHKKALDYIMINKPNYLNMTTSFFIEAAKQYLLQGRFKDRKLDWIFTSFAVGEKLSPGEEKFINQFLRKARAGSAVSIKGFKLPFTTIGVAGGDCEHGAIFYTLWHKLFEMKAKIQGVKECGMFPEAYVNVTALKLDENGNYVECKYGEPGIIVANSYSNFSCYKNNPEATSHLLITDNMGRTWISCSVYGYIDKLGGVHMKGREELLLTTKDKSFIPPYKIEDVISKDTKNILSCQVLDNEGVVTSIIQFQPNVNSSKAVSMVRGRVAKSFGEEFANNMEIIVLPIEQSYPLTHSGKRKLAFDREQILEKTKNPKKLQLHI